MQLNRAQAHTFSRDNREIDLHILDNDQDIQAILLTHGVLSAIHPKKGRNTGYAFFRINNFLACAAKMIGHQRPEDNGYILYPISLEKISLQEATEIAVELFELNDVKNIVVIEEPITPFN